MARRRRQRDADQHGRLEGKAPIKAAALAVLLEAPGHGYDVAGRINKRLGSWAVNPKNIYDPLKQLERAGLVRHQKEPIPEPPGFRKVYYVTDAARQAREDWFDSRPALSVLRADIHARLAFSTEDDLPDLLRALREYRADLLEEIKENERRWAASRDTWLGLVISHLRAEVEKQCKAEIEWVNDVAADLKKRAGPPA
jgi:DNA-binding PadR family transcriptional regulator